MSSANSFRVFETTYFSLLVTELGPDAVCGDLVQKLPLPIGATAEVLEVICPFLVQYSGYKIDILVALTDHYLFRDLQAVGLRWKGYTHASEVSEEGSVRIFLRDGECFLGFRSVDRFVSGKEGDLPVNRLVLSFNGEVTHPVASDGKSWAALSKVRERYILGLSSPSESEGLKSSRVSKAPIRTPSVSQGQESPSWDSVRRGRRSAERMGGLRSPNLDELGVLLEEAFLRDGKGRRPFAIAGDYGDHSVWIATDGSAGDGMTGLFKFDETERTFFQQSKEDVCKAIFRFGFSQEPYQGAPCWMIIQTHIGRLTRKYGKRGRRFGLLEAGALIQAVSLSAATHRIRCRILGGYDDYGIESVLGESTDLTIVPALVALGVPK